MIRAGRPIGGGGARAYAILIKDEKNNTVRLVQTTSTTTNAITTTSTTNTGQQQQQQTQVHYVNASGLTKEAGLELASQIAANYKVQPGAKVVAVPVSNVVGSPSIKMSSFKQEPATILPKPAPSNVQRIVTLGATSPRTPSTDADSSGATSGASASADAVAWATKRVHDYADSNLSDASKRTKKVLVGGALSSAVSCGKGLRHFSMKVCEKVQRKGVTSYNEVADELVAEFSDPQRNMTPTDQAYDQKNIRRRVYDALNVLMAMNIISKEKKEIRWLGLPTNSAQECDNLEVQKSKRLDRIRVKTQHLQDLLLQQIAFKNLVQRNKQLEKVSGIPMANSAIHLPFIIVNTSKKTVIDCSISADKMEYLFSFDNTFEIHDDIEVLKRMGMTHGLERGDCSPSQLDKLKKMVPKSLESYIGQIAEGGTSNVLTSTSIVAGPSGLLTGRPMGVLSPASSTDSRIRQKDIGKGDSAQICVREDSETLGSDDDGDFSESEMDADEDDDDITIDVN